MPDQVQPVPAQPPSPAAKADGASLIEQYDPEGASSPAAPEPAAPSPPPPVAQPPAPPKHSPYLRQMAAEFGISDEERDKLEPDQLGSMVYHLTKMALSEKEARSQAHATHAAMESPKPPPAPPVAPEAPKVDLGLKEENWEPELVTGLKKAATFYESRIKALEDRVAALTGHAVQQAEETRHGKIDREFQALGPEYKSLIGDGSREALKPDSPEMARRIAILGEAMRLAGPGAQDAQALAMIQRAAQNLFGAGSPAAAQPPGAAQPPAAPSQRAKRPQRPDGTFMSDAEIEEQKRWEAAGLARPSQRTGAPELDGAVKATRNVQKLLDGMGQTDDQDTAKDEFLPSAGSSR